MNGEGSFHDFTGRTSFPKSLRIERSGSKTFNVTMASGNSRVCFGFSAAEIESFISQAKSQLELDRKIG